MSSDPAFKTISTAFETPLNDDRSYDLIELSNKLQVLFIHDPLSYKSAASLDVNVGSFNDPPDLNGLAHFCEHLLFMGTANYPDENDYQKFLSNHSGFSNAFTANYHTNYYFEIDSNHLIEALLRFSRFFIDPLFLQSCQDREIIAINNENNKNLNDDNWRYYQVYKKIINPSHPFCQFSTGNLDTLKHHPESKNINIRNELIKWYDSHYSSDIMKLTILSNLNFNKSLNDAEHDANDDKILKYKIVNFFNQIQNKNLTKDPTIFFYNSISIKSDLNHLKLIKFKPVLKNKSLQLKFHLPISYHDFYKYNPILLISNLIGHETKGSLFYYLKFIKKYILALTTSTDFISNNNLLFLINISLTDSGFENYQKLILYIFQYLKYLKSLSNDQIFEKFDELSQISQFNFKFKEKLNSNFKTVSSLATSLQSLKYFDSKNLLNYHFPFVKTYNFELISKILNDYLVPDNILIFLSNYQFDKKIDVPLVEPYYKSNYSIHDINPTLLNDLHNCQLNENFHLPIENPLIPAHFNLISDNNNNNNDSSLPSSSPPANTDSDENYVNNDLSCHNNINDANNISITNGNLDTSPLLSVETTSTTDKLNSSKLEDPILYKNNDYIRIWFKDDKLFNQPKGFISINFQIPHLNDSPVNQIYSQFLKKLLKFELNDISYFGELISINIELNVLSNGLLLQISGFNDRFDRLLEILFENLIGFQNDSSVNNQSNFEFIKDDIIKELKNSQLNSPYYQIGNYSSNLLCENDWTINEKLIFFENNENSKESAITNGDIKGGNNVNFDSNDKIKQKNYLTFDKFQNFLSGLFTQCYLEVYIHGNFTIDNVKTVENTINKQFFNKINWKTFIPNQLNYPRNYLLPEGSHYRYNIDLIDKSDVNSCIEYNFQIGDACDMVHDLQNPTDYDYSLDDDFSPRKKLVLIELLHEIFPEPTFDQLRTKEQLGYVVFSLIRRIRNYVGYRFIIQSDKESSYLETRINSFLTEKLKEIILNLTDEQFKLKVQSLKTEYRNILLFKNMRDEFSYYLNKIYTKFYNFNLIEKKFKLVDEINKEDLVNFFKKYFLDENTSTRLIIYLKTTNEEIIRTHNQNKDQIDQNLITKCKEIKSKFAAQSEFLMSKTSSPVSPLKKIP
ncbi:uncharacterized protein ASCRUDRAFT_75856 [Ascoidea rubescens DSM 1968]|uniref:LuxS/MPP-like metallohydrolase n=1 Tax=Ascoidea rubescens DSM 1968 TaxID=1344418 RepID=A0A1D2VI35_9ASCO|nr:hypothetical protein ASCRUDRAFT_75856 [Ascoidea rubescens DSM 1968]ODV61137.1 hypothetical protein ASCRUDRAFT_75856 [Ascoidea rubescens DSM 1968]